MSSLRDAFYEVVKDQYISGWNAGKDSSKPFDIKADEAVDALIQAVEASLPDIKTDPVEGYHFQWYNGWNHAVTTFKKNIRG